MKKLAMTLLVGGLFAGVASAESLRLTTATASAVIETRGARAVSCKFKGEELFWNDNPVQLEAKGWAHGGMPICWPWFGKNAELVFHGTAWKSEFTVVRRETSEARALLALRLAKDGDEITVTYTLTDRLRVDVTVANHGTSARRVSFGLHPYFSVGERDSVYVHGFRPRVWQVNAAIDDVEPIAPVSNGRFLIEDRSRHHAIELKTEGWPFVNLWNPGDPPPDDMPGALPAEACRRFVCLEPLWRQRQPLVLKPGETRSFGAEFAIVPMPSVSVSADGKR